MRHMGARLRASCSTRLVTRRSTATLGLPKRLGGRVFARRSRGETFPPNINPSEIRGRKLIGLSRMTRQRTVHLDVGIALGESFHEGMEGVHHRALECPSEKTNALIHRSMLGFAVIRSVFGLCLGPCALLWGNAKPVTGIAVTPNIPGFAIPIVESIRVCCPNRRCEDQSNNAGESKSEHRVSQRRPSHEDFFLDFHTGRDLPLKYPPSGVSA